VVSRYPGEQASRARGGGKARSAVEARHERASGGAAGEKVKPPTGEILGGTHMQWPEKVPLLIPHN